MGFIVRAIAWFAPIAAGWFASDVYNESQTTQQLEASTFANAAKTTVTKWWKIGLILIGLAAIIFFVFKKFNLKIGKR